MVERKARTAPTPNDEAYLAVENAKIRIECLKLARGESHGIQNLIASATEILAWVTE